MSILHIDWSGHLTDTRGTLCPTCGVVIESWRGLTSLPYCTAAPCGHRFYRDHLTGELHPHE